MRDSLEDLERIFEKFQTSDKLDTERSITQGMFIRLGRTANKEEDFQMLEQLERLIYISEKEGFKRGFKAAYQLKLSKPASSSRDAVNIQRYIKKQII